LEASSELSLNLRKSWSHHHQSPEKTRQSGTHSMSSKRDKGMNYGNKAQEFDGIQRDLEHLQKTLLGELRMIVNCEIANILFANEATNELLLYANKRWFRVPIMSSIAGACYLANEVVYVPDAYADTRFNRYILNNILYYVTIAQRDIVQLFSILMAIIIFIIKLLLISYK